MHTLPKAHTHLVCLVAVCLQLQSKLKAAAAPAPMSPAPGVAGAVGGGKVQGKGKGKGKGGKRGGGGGGRSGAATLSPQPSGPSILIPQTLVGAQQETEGAEQGGWGWEGFGVFNGVAARAGEGG